MKERPYAAVVELAIRNEVARTGSIHLLKFKPWFIGLKRFLIRTMDITLLRYLAAYLHFVAIYMKLIDTVVKRPNLRR